MKIITATRVALWTFAAASLTACGGSPPPGARAPQIPAATGRTDSGTYKTLYSFNGGGGDGASPLAPLINMGGTLYGTTFAGGPYNCSPYKGCGTIFSVTLSGTEKVLHSFSGGGTDGANPNAGLINVGGTLYGTTSNGGSTACYGSYYASCGTVFSITPGGAEKVLHNFGGSPDGAYPYAGLINVNRTLYGTTSAGGYFCYSSVACGTVFTITTA